jgi:hypothetical protein
MKTKLIFIIIFALFIFCAGQSVFAMTETERQTLIDQIQQQIAQLLILVKQLQAQEKTTTNKNPVCQPDCTNKKCGQSNNCGGRCFGICDAPSNTCDGTVTLSGARNNDYKCVYHAEALVCPAGKINELGFCVTPAQQTENLPSCTDNGWWYQHFVQTSATASTSDIEKTCNNYCNNDAPKTVGQYGGYNGTMVNSIYSIYSYKGKSNGQVGACCKCVTKEDSCYATSTKTSPSAYKVSFFVPFNGLGGNGWKEVANKVCLEKCNLMGMDINDTFAAPSCLAGAAGSTGCLPGNEFNTATCCSCKNKDSCSSTGAGGECADTRGLDAKQACSFYCKTKGKYDIYANYPTGFVFQYPHNLLYKQCQGTAVSSGVCCDCGDGALQFTCGNGICNQGETDWGCPADCALGASETCKTSGIVVNYTDRFKCCQGLVWYSFDGGSNGKCDSAIK